MSPELERLYLKSVVSACEKQGWLTDFIGQRGWQVNMAAARLLFGEDLSWKVQLLGTESYIIGTWLWAWANPGFPSRLTMASRALQDYGYVHGIEELTLQSTQMTAMQGHQACVVASSVLPVKAYYKAPYQEGAAFFLITDPTYPTPSLDAMRRLTSVYPRALEIYEPSNQRAAFEAYVDQLGLSRRADGPRVVIERDGLAVVTASFDEANRLRDLTAHPGGRPRLKVRVCVHFVRSPADYASQRTPAEFRYMLERVREIWGAAALDFELQAPGELSDQQLDAAAWSEIVALKDWTTAPAGLLRLKEQDPLALHVVCTSSRLPSMQATFATDSIILLGDGPPQHARPLARAFGMVFGVGWAMASEQLMSMGSGTHLSESEIQLARQHVEKQRVKA